MEDPGGMAGTHSLAGGEAVDCVEVDLLHPRRKWVVGLWWGCGGMSLSVHHELYRP